jgi:hypothetical protein
VVLQGVHQLMSHDVGNPWNHGEQRISKLVFIGIELPRELMMRSLQQCPAVKNAFSIAGRQSSSSERGCNGHRQVRRPGVANTFRNQSRRETAGDAMTKLDAELLRPSQLELELDGFPKVSFNGNVSYTRLRNTLTQIPQNGFDDI